MRQAIRRAMRIYFNGRTYLGDGEFVITERASKAGEALEVYAKSHPELVTELARQRWIQHERLGRAEAWAWKGSLTP